MRNAMWVGGGVTGMGEIPMLGVKENGIAKVIRDIFRNGEQGFFYDPTDLTPLMQNWRTNLLTWTEDFTKWANGFTATPVTDGWLLERTDSAAPYVSSRYPIGTSAAAGTIVRSIELKKGTADFVRVGGASDGAAISIDLRDLTIRRNTGGRTYTIQELGDGWIRIEFFAYLSSFGATSMSNTISWGMTYSGSSVDTEGAVGSTIYARKPSFSYIPDIESTDSIPYQPITDFNTDFLNRFPDHTIFQNSAGTIPVTAREQPIGLIRDKSGLNNHAQQTTSAARPILQQTPILGNELVVNGDFNNGLDGWVGNNTVTLNRDTSIFSSGGAKITVNASQSTHFYTNLGSNFVVGKRYIASAVVYTPSTNTADVVAAIGFVPSSLTKNTVMQKNTNVVEKLSMEFVATSTTHSLYCSVAKKNATVWGAVGDVAYFANVSVKEVTGYHTNQDYIAYDGVDDKLLTNLPAPLVNATVLRAIPYVGTQVKYSQTLPMLYEDSTNHAGLIAIDRALTRQEQLRLMVALDKRAGATSLETLTFRAFDDNQEGFVYDPNDLSTMFQDVDAVNRVTQVGQPVGLILDKSKPNGRELAVNGSFKDGTTGWTLAGTAKLTSQGVNITGLSSAGSLTQTVTCEVGKTYLLTAKVTTAKGNIANGTGTTMLFYGTRVVTATSTTHSLYFRNYGSSVEADFTITDISFREISSNYAYQATSAARPILRKNAETGSNYLEFDGADDYLRVSSLALPSPLTLLYAVDKSSGIYGVLLSVANVGYTNISTTSMGFSGSGSIARKSPKDVVSYRFVDTKVHMRSSVAEGTETRANSFTNRGNKYIGLYSASGSVKFNGSIYGIVAITKDMPISEEDNFRSLFNSRLGE